MSLLLGAHTLIPKLFEPTSSLTFFADYLCCDRIARISLEDDDLELLAENTGRKVASRSDFSRLRRGRASPTADAHPPTSSRDILAAELSDDGSQRDVMEGIFEEDDNESFIDDEDSEEDLGAMGEEELAQKRRERKQDAQRRKKAMDARPELAGIDAGAWDEIYDVFGAGDDYDWALDEDEAHSDHEGAPKEMRYQDVCPVSTILPHYWSHLPYASYSRCSNLQKSPLVS